MVKYKAIIGLGVIIGAFLFGAEWKDRAWSKRVAEAEKERISTTLNVEREQKRLEAVKLEQVGVILDEQETEKEVIYREKIVYRNNPDAGTCKFPSRGVQIINSAAGLSPVPAPASDAKAEAKAVSDIEVVDVVTANYQMCRRELTKYFGLWQWAESVYNLNK